MVGTISPSQLLPSAPPFEQKCQPAWKRRRQMKNYIVDPSCGKTKPPFGTASRLASQAIFAEALPNGTFPNGEIQNSFTTQAAQKTKKWLLLASHSNSCFPYLYMDCVEGIRAVGGGAEAEVLAQQHGDATEGQQATNVPTRARNVCRSTAVSVEQRHDNMEVRRWMAWHWRGCRCGGTGEVGSAHKGMERTR
ncbi:hypothetical protein SEVIR_5G035550v4 [Setaria viridis]|uniref:Uncharacterized protein n=1 Tax=Setaria viridis TaxID=4556 RepID=A0A4V6D601_SETVI|nr:hypothetical protein SEVIR_5G035550v2 [Setaria viridis]